MKKYVILSISIFCSIMTIAQSKSQAPWQQQVDYLIDVKLDDVNHMLNGDIAITYTNNSPTSLSEIYIHLWPNGYKNNNTAFAKQMEENGDLDFYYAKEVDRGYIDNIAFTANGKSLSVLATEHIDVIRVQLAEPLATGNKITLFTPFKVKVPKVFSRLGHQNQDYFISQWYPKPAVYDVNGWNAMPYLNLGEFYSEFGSFKVSITVPQNYVVTATGECQNENELTDYRAAPDEEPASSTVTKTVVFNANKVHDFAWFASKRWGYVTKKIVIDDKVILARVVSPNPDVKYLENIETAVTYYSEHVGLYPYSHATVVHGELKAGGGMEYPMITLCDFLNEEVIVHEVGHNWFYGILANNERTYPWMDESINSYYEGEAMKKGEGSKPDVNSGIMMALVNDNLLRNEHQAIGTSSAELTEGNYGMSVYGIGAKSFGYLKAYLGDETYKKCMKTYFDTWKFKHPLPNDMKASFEKTSGQSLGWFFDDLLNMNGKLDFAVAPTKGGYKLTNLSSIEAPVPLQITTAEGTKVTWHILKPNESKLITAGSKSAALIDPKSSTVDLNNGNNASPSKLKIKAFTGMDKPGITEVYMVPTIGWNAYDKTMVGVGIHNYAISDKALQYYIMPMYSFAKKSLNGTAAISYTKPLGKPAQYMEIGAKAMSFDFEQRLLADREYKFLKIAPYMEYHFPKSNLRSLVSKMISLQYDHIFLDPRFAFNSDTLAGPQIIHNKSRDFVTATYKYENKRALNSYSWNTTLEYGSLANTVIAGKRDTAIYGMDTVRFFSNVGSSVKRQSFARLSSVFKYNVDIGIKNKPLELRFYGSYIVQYYPSTELSNSVGSTDRAGYYDYKFDDYLMHRNANYGLFRNQISNRRDFSKFVGPVLNSDKWLVTANVTVPLPGKIPLKPYAEIATVNDIKTQGFNTSGVGFIYNLGVEIEIIPNRFELFLNLAQSSEVSDYQDNGFNTIDTFLERITFVFDLNNLNPNKLKKQIKLF